MPAVEFTETELAMLSDPEDRVEIRHMTAQKPQHTPAVGFYQAEGKTLPTAFRGESQAVTWSFDALFARDEHAEALALIDLITRAFFEDTDGRLLLKTRVGQVAGLDPLYALIITSWSPAPRGGNLINVTFEGQAVAFDEDMIEDHTGETLDGGTP